MKKFRRPCNNLHMATESNRTFQTPVSTADTSVNTQSQWTVKSSSVACFSVCYTENLFSSTPTETHWKWSDPL